MRVGTVVLVGLVSFSPIVAAKGQAQSLRGADHWMIAGGQGGCSSVTAMQRDLRGLTSWSSPEEFVNGLREKGIQVSTVTGEFQGRYLVKVVVPARGVDVVFVPYSLCRIMWQEELDRHGRRPSPQRREGSLR